MSEPVSLSKVTLTKSAPAVSLTKRGTAGGLLRVNLNWKQPEGGGGLFRRKPKGVDLDLACLYELSSGEKGVVQALGNSFRAHAPGVDAPVLQLDADDRSGTAAGGENLTVDLGQLPALKRVLVFAYIYEGAPNWAEADAVVTLTPAQGPQVEVRLDEHDPQARTCAIALLSNEGGELVVHREVRYVQGTQQALDSAYGWGLQWQAGRK
ncbi:tellurite resistance protein TerA [Motilibacter peucedani]|uniref:Tellurite resistance protein TerA n=1 Tax=Motilibacter peucedani TaxID=598650 RepID=A0A420XMW7_9ACTN|nr:tellurium resistance protein [Motilibacter peucedani]RKS72616.1 tellurite resistance protein TerA [Motilibacter peucedani]